MADFSCSEFSTWTGMFLPHWHPEPICADGKLVPVSVFSNSIQKAIVGWSPYVSRLQKIDVEHIIPFESFSVAVPLKMHFPFLEALISLCQLWIKVNIFTVGGAIESSNKNMMWPCSLLPCDWLMCIKCCSQVDEDLSLAGKGLIAS